MNGAVFDDASADDDLLQVRYASEIWERCRDICADWVHEIPSDALISLWRSLGLALCPVTDSDGYRQRLLFRGTAPSVAASDAEDGGSPR